MVSPYVILDIDPDASEEAIEAAYRKRIKETHPDLGGSVPDFIAVKEAYDQLQEGWTPTEERNAGKTSQRPRTREQREAMGATVTYLDYEYILDQHWSPTQEAFDNAEEEGIGPPYYGQFDVEAGDTVLEAAEASGLTWPYACRGGACANCAVKCISGEIDLPPNTILTEEELNEDVRLACNGYPGTEDLTVISNFKSHPALEELLLPPGPFKRAMAGAD